MKRRNQKTLYMGKTLKTLRKNREKKVKDRKLEREGC